MKTVAQNIIAFNRQLHYTGKLPKGFDVLNPFRENPETMKLIEAFYLKFYNDHHKRKFIIGINPGRHGAGITGIPFTDTKRLEAFCKIKMHSAHSHEPSSIFVYDMIAKYGGVKKFYSNFYINSVFPLAIVKQTSPGKWRNANYYDDNLLFKYLKPFMIGNLKTQIPIGLDTSAAFVLGKKNTTFLEKINNEEKLFQKIITLEHPRYIQQYKSKQKEEYIDKYLQALS
ncbi:MAG: SMUG2 DNA glycosylase family protein [Bacteroidetes bacterium]|nr:SMUG2 DNA glycosylase family protein [Bacteroidota bacterium]